MRRGLEREYTEAEKDILDAWQEEPRCRCRSTSIEPCDYCDGSLDGDENE